MPNQTPAEQGFIMPAEWEWHKATWLGWPLNPEDWPGKFEPIGWVYGEIVRHIVRGSDETARIVVHDAAHERQAREVLEKVGVAMQDVEFYQTSMNRGWMRDCMSSFVKNRSTKAKAAIKFTFNGWAKYDNWQFDNAIANRIAPHVGWNIIEAVVPESTGGKRQVVLEGGSIDVNGYGTLLTTEECLLDPLVQVRNPGMNRTEMENALKTNLGVTNVLWQGTTITYIDTRTLYAGTYMVKMTGTSGTTTKKVMLSK
jgi:agmatine deiminase